MSSINQNNGVVTEGPARNFRQVLERQVATAPQSAQIDFGATPVPSATFTITDASVNTSTLISILGATPITDDADAAEGDALFFYVTPALGSFSVFVRSADGSYLSDKYNMAYAHN